MNTQTNATSFQTAVEKLLLKAGYEIRQYADHQGLLAGKWYWRKETAEMKDCEGEKVIVYRLSATYGFRGNAALAALDDLAEQSSLNPNPKRGPALGPSKGVFFDVPLELREQFKQACRAKGVAEAAILRALVRAYVENQGEAK